MTYIDEPDKKQKHPKYEQLTAKLDEKNNDFTCKKFQQVRIKSTHKKLLESFRRIGMCLNSKYISSIPVQNLDKVCFILMNDYNQEDSRLGVGPLNDGYLIGLKHFRLGYKVFYLYNCSMSLFPSFLGFLLRNTKESLTVFYSGRDDKIMNGIEFDDGTLFKEYITEAIRKYSNDQLRVTYITDIIDSGSVFDISGISNAISYYVKKTGENSKETNLTHGIFTYYFCKITNEFPNITPNEIIGKMNLSLKRFNEELTCDCSNKDIKESPIFVDSKQTQSS